MVPLSLIDTSESASGRTIARSSAVKATAGSRQSGAALRSTFSVPPETGVPLPPEPEPEPAPAEEPLEPQAARAIPVTAARPAKARRLPLTGHRSEVSLMHCLSYGEPLNQPGGADRKARPGQSSATGTFGVLS